MSALDTAKEAYGADLPDWIEALARECVRTSQGQTAKRLGYTGGMISTVLRNKYAASTQQIEERVRGELMKATIACPRIGEIGRQVCQKWRKRAGAEMHPNTLHIQMARACRNCPHFEGLNETTTEAE
jgi:hypothetical protein